MKRRPGPWAVALVCLVPLMILRGGTLAEGDTFWEIRAGQLILRDHALPRVDTFSWTAAGRSWTLNSWGFDVLAAVAHLAGGLAGVALLTIVLGCAVLSAVLWSAARLGASPVPTAVLLALTSPLLIGSLQARPQLADYLAVPAVIVLLEPITRADTAAGRRIRALAGLAAVCVVWVNLHASALTAAGLCVGAAVVLFLVPGRRRDGAWAASAAVIAVLASLINPYCTGLFAQTRSVQHASGDLIVEWAHLDPTAPSQLAVLAIGLAATVLAARRQQWVLVGSLAVALAGAVEAVRLQPVLLVISLPVLAAALSGPRLLARYSGDRRLLITAVVLWIVAMSALVVPAATHLGRPEPAQYPTALIARIPSGCHLYNDYLVGSLVTLQRPDVLVSLDSRNDMYGAPFVRASRDVLLGRAPWQDALAGADCALVRNDIGLGTELASSGRWRTAGTEGLFSLYLRAGRS